MNSTACFFHLVSALCFSAALGSARPYKDDLYAPDLDHMIVFVRLGQNHYLCDVGFGSLFSEPKMLQTNVVQLDYNKYFKFEKDTNDAWLLKSSLDNSDYQTEYLFEPKPRAFIEFMGRCIYHQESNESHFKQQKLITQLFAEGRVTLTNRKLKMNWLGEEVIQKVNSEDEFLYFLHEKFGIQSHQLFHQKFD